MAEHFNVRNVKCAGCIDAIRSGLIDKPGVTGIEVSIDNATVTVEGQSLDRALLSKSLAALGYPEITEQSP